MNCMPISDFSSAKVKPLLPVLCTFWVNRIAIIKAKINKSKNENQGGNVVFFPALGRVLLWKLYSHDVITLLSCNPFLQVQEKGGGGECSRWRSCIPGIAFRPKETGVCLSAFSVANEEFSLDSVTVFSSLAENKGKHTVLQDCLGIGVWGVVPSWPLKMFYVFLSYFVHFLSFKVKLLNISRLAATKTENWLKWKEWCKKKNPAQPHVDIRNIFSMCLFLSTSFLPSSHLHTQPYCTRQLLFSWVFTDPWTPWSFQVGFWGEGIVKGWSV